MTARHRVLLSAMDAGAAHHMVQLHGLLSADADLAVSLHACGAAARIFDAAAIPFTPFQAVPADPRHPSTDESIQLRAHADAVVASERPTLVIGGLSNTGNGPDEAFGAAGRAAGVVTATLLDDRGPLYTIDGRFADHLLATSPAILKWADAVSGARVHMIGSLKHHALSLKSADDIRTAVRRRMGVGDERLVAFVAQSDAMEGHNEKFVDLVTILEQDRDRLPPFRLVIRVHPGAPRAGLWCWEEAVRRGLPAECDRGDHDILEMLAASDALFSCSSTSMTDYIWLSLGGHDLTAVPVYLLGGAIQRWLEATQGTWMPDLVARGLAVVATDVEQLRDFVHRALAGVLSAPNTDRNSIRDMADPFSVTLRVIRSLAGLSNPV